MLQKPPNFVKVITFSAVFASRHLVASISAQKNLKFAEKKIKFFRWKKWSSFDDSIAISILALNHLVASIPSQHNQFSPKKGSFCQWPKWTLMTFTQNRGKVNKTRRSEHTFGNLSFQTSSCIHSYPKIITFCRKVHISVCYQNKLTLMNL